MKILFKYRENSYYKVVSISVFGSFNHYERTANQMIYKDGLWSIEIDLPRGIHLYKFLINNEIEIIDPYNADIQKIETSDNIWSFISIDETGAYYNISNQNSIELLNYYFNSIMTDNKSIINKQNFYLVRDNQMIGRFDFAKITGRHVITLLWISPQGDTVEYSENLIEASQSDEIVSVWFWSQLKETNKMEGLWKWILLIDGIFTYTDYLVVLSTQDNQLIKQYI